MYSLPYRTTIASANALYRITSIAFTTGGPTTYPDVVNGMGAKKSRKGARYNYPGALTVYLTENLATCFAEKMFYFHREVVRGIDQLHLLGTAPPPPFQQTFALWEIELKNPVNDVADLTIPAATAYFSVFPSLPLNPSQDYDHLKDARANIESKSYNGILVGSSRVTSPGNLIVLFDDQSSNLASITPYLVEFRLTDVTGAPFINHVTQTLDFTTGEVQFSGTTPPAGTAYSTWQKVDFNH